LAGWQGFLVAYNEFCSQNNGTPLTAFIFDGEMEKIRSQRHAMSNGGLCAATKGSIKCNLLDCCEGLGSKVGLIEFHCFWGSLCLK